MKTRKPTAVVVVQGGVVQSVMLNGPNMEVILVDYDTEGYDERGMKKDHDGSPCHYGIWSGKDEGNVQPDLVLYWKGKDRLRKPRAKLTIKDERGIVYNLSKEIYMVKNSCPNYTKGKMVRLISGIFDTRLMGPSKTPGYHFTPNWLTVTPIDSKKPQWRGFHESELSLVEG
jgi:hypothetical protein